MRWIAGAAVLSLAAMVPADAAAAKAASNAFDRWQGERWYVSAQIGLPYPATLYADKNHQLQFAAADVELVMACSEAHKLGKALIEVDCVIEDVALQVAPYRTTPGVLESGKVVIEETDAKLTGLTVQLQARADGRVTNVSFGKVPADQRRTRILWENLRVLVARTVSGMHLQRPATLADGVAWREKNSSLYHLPIFQSLGSTLDQAEQGSGTDGGGSVDRGGRGAPTTGTAMTTGQRGGAAASVGATGNNIYALLQAAAPQGSFVLDHTVSNFEGQLILQSIGHGTVHIGESAQMSYDAHAQGVAVVDGAAGWVSERVYSVTMTPTASSVTGDGGGAWNPWQTGVVSKLAADAQRPLGETLLVSPPGSPVEGLPAWPNRE